MKRTSASPAAPNLKIKGLQTCAQFADVLVHWEMKCITVIEWQCWLQHMSLNGRSEHNKCHKKVALMTIKALSGRSDQVNIIEW